MAKSSIAAWLLLAAAPLALAAAEAEAIFEFAKANAGKFASEIAPSAGGVVRVQFDRILEGKFDAAAGQFVGEATWNRVSGVTLFKRCRTLGTYIGKNAFGVGVKVSRQTCEELAIADTGKGLVLANDHVCTAEKEDIRPYWQPRCDPKAIGNLRVVLPMNPDQYRAARAKGYILEAEFLIGGGAKEEVVSLARYNFKPKIDFPFEQALSSWTVFGEIRSLTLYSPDGKTALFAVQR